MSVGRLSIFLKDGVQEGLLGIVMEEKKGWLAFTHPTWGGSMGNAAWDGLKSERLIL